MKDYLVTVCSVCRCASCWHGEFMCEASQLARTVEVPASASELRGEHREHPSNFSAEKLRDVCGTLRYVS